MTGHPVAEGLRERKKRAMRRQLSDTATDMFLQHGFDEVRVVDIAEACGVSEKTVFNYFPTKEALLLDRLEATGDALRTYLADPALPPVTAMLRVLDEDLDRLAAGFAAAPDLEQALGRYRGFGDLVRTTPSLRTYLNTIADRYVGVAAEVLAARAGYRHDDPEPQITAAALLGLWRIQFAGLRSRLQPGRPVPDSITAVRDDVRRAAALIENGIAEFPPAAGARET
ncbi:TetR family transcriptional regulator [Kutzneria sp. 744]|uniref:TetR family transcriptional regulator n=1 Tax=Kutzneria sp. (strain 744) TaxID=345341 RepID=UPI0003EED769|nr:TetR family transcriptional regulator [Kutzneria sp. 744]EWM18928.1 TetR-family transcriptional regulator [Kutzneria sp. 744]